MSEDGISSVSLEQTRSGRPWWQVCCTGCVLIVVAVTIGAWFLFHGATKTGSVQLTTLPQDFPKDIVLYRMDSATSILFIEGKNTNTFLQTVLAPLHLLTRGTGATTTPSMRPSTTAPTMQSAVSVLDTYAETLKDMNTVIVSWDRIMATRKDVLEYYQASFDRGGFTSTTTRDTVTGTDIVVATRPNASIQLQMQETEQGQGIAAIVAAVTYSLKP